MADKSEASAFNEELMEVMEKYHMTSNLSMAEVIGVLESIKLQVAYSLLAKVNKDD